MNLEFFFYVIADIISSNKSFFFLNLNKIYPNKLIKICCLFSNLIITMNELLNKMTCNNKSKQQVSILIQSELKALKKKLDDICQKLYSQVLKIDLQKWKIIHFYAHTHSHTISIICFCSVFFKFNFFFFFFLSLLPVSEKAFWRPPRLLWRTLRLW